MTDVDIAGLFARSESDPASLTLDEVGVLFFVTRDRIRAIEAKARSRSGNNDGLLGCVFFAFEPPGFPRLTR